MSNQEIAKILYEIGEYLEMDGVPFKPRAYQRAAGSIESLEEEAGKIYKKGGLKALESIPGIGVSIAEKIEELIKTGKLRYYQQLKKKMPVDLSELTSVEGLGPKIIQKLYQELEIKTIKDLEKAAKAGKIRTLKDFGAKSEENILKGIEFLKGSQGRSVLGFVMPLIRNVKARLEKAGKIKKVVIAGSVRRRKETIGDIDILAVSSKPEKVMDYFTSLPEVERVYAHGKTKSSVRLKAGLDADMRIVPLKSFGAALNYFTGSKDHNVALREMALKKGWKLNEYGLFRKDKMIAGQTEEDLYKALGLKYIEPELRENTGEIQAAQKDALPDLIGYDDLKGDLQIQTDWSDGSHSIAQMAERAMKAGLEYIAITDHTKRLAMTHGLDEKRLIKQMKEIDEINLRLKTQDLRFKVLKGTECDILKDGSLDLPDSILEKLDAVGASIHSHFNLLRKEQTERVIKVMRNPNVDIIFHLTARILKRREACDMDIERIIEAAKETGTILEINAYPDRLDIKDEHIRRCVEKGVKMSIDSDAHSPEHLGYLEYGVAQARRGWASKRDIINAWPLEKMLSFLKKG